MGLDNHYFGSRGYQGKGPSARGRDTHAVSDAVAGIGDDGGPGVEARAQSPASCTTLGKNTYVRDQMTDLYLWYREIPDVDPAGFSSPGWRIPHARTSRRTHAT